MITTSMSLPLKIISEKFKKHFIFFSKTLYLHQIKNVTTMAKATTGEQVKAPRKKKQTATEPAELPVEMGNQHQDAEEVHAEEIDEMPEGSLALVPAEIQASKEIKKFNMSREWIAKKKEAYQGLTIAGPQDKEGKQKVLEAWREMRNKRLQVKKVHETVKADYLFISRAIDGEKNDLTKLLTEVEDPLKAELDRIEAIEQEEKDRIIREAEQRLHARVTSLLEIGMKFDGAFYSIGETISMDVVTLKQMSEDEFNVLSEKVKVKNQEIIDAEQKIRDDEAAEKQRVEDQRVENERKEKELADEREALAKEKRDGRVEQLTALGYKMNHAGQYSFSIGTYGHMVPEGDLATWTADEWKSLLMLAKEKTTILTEQHQRDEEAAAADKKKKDEEEKLEREKQHRIELREQQLSNLFQIIRQPEGQFVRVQEYTSVPEIFVFASDVEAMEPADWDNLIGVLSLEYESVKEAVNLENERLRQKQESERVAALDDAQKVFEWLKLLSNAMAKVPEIQNENVKLALSTFDSSFAASMEMLVDSLNELEAEK